MLLIHVGFDNYNHDKMLSKDVWNTSCQQKMRKMIKSNLSVDINLSRKDDSNDVLHKHERRHK